MERIRKIFLYRHLLWDMSIKQLKIKYSGARLGFWWALIVPLILAGSINFVFTKVFRIYIPDYTLFVLAGIIPWLFFSNALSEVTNSFIVNSAVLKQGIFLREFIPISSILANFFSFLIGFIVLSFIFVIFRLKVITTIFFIIFPLISQLIFIIGLGLLFSLCNVFFRDLSQILPVVFMIWFWVTPIFYSIEMVPLPFRWVCFVNPMSYYTILYQKILFHAEVPSLRIILTSFLVGLFSLFIGYYIFLKNEKFLLKKI